MSTEKINLVERIENLRDSIDYLRGEIWKMDRARLTEDVMERELEKLLLEYRNCISEDIAS